jgi:uracil-DNA glycosylase
MMKLSDIPLHSEWAEHLSKEFGTSEMQGLSDFLTVQRQAKKIIHPDEMSIFAAFNETPLNKVRVVILGQDPYHGYNQAHGLSFSVPKRQAIPPSLKNIYKELQSDLGCFIPTHGNLVGWAKQGVLLLNAVLTVEHSLAGSHQKKGWEVFTDKAIALINEQREGVVFLLWGAYAHKKGAAIDSSKHLVLKAPHPSPLSCYRGFYGCRHFSQANDYLRAHGQDAIDWQIS